MASMATTGLAAQSLGYEAPTDNSGQGVMARLNSALADQRKRRLQGAAPADRSMQMMPSSVKDLFSPGSLGSSLAGP